MVPRPELRGAGLAGVALVGIGTSAARYYAAQAWAFIPRRRQDRHRALSWEIVTAVVVGHLVLFGSAGPQDRSVVAWGIAMMPVAGAVVGAGMLVGRYRAGPG